MSIYNIPIDQWIESFLVFEIGYEMRTMVIPQHRTILPDGKLVFEIPDGATTNLGLEIASVLYELAEKYDPILRNLTPEQRAKIIMAESFNLARDPRPHSTGLPFAPPLFGQFLDPTHLAPYTPFFAPPQLQFPPINPQAVIANTNKLYQVIEIDSPLIIQMAGKCILSHYRSMAASPCTHRQALTPQMFEVKPGLAQKLLRVYQVMRQNPLRYVEDGPKIPMPKVFRDMIKATEMEKEKEKEREKEKVVEKQKKRMSNFNF